MLGIHVDKGETFFFFFTKYVSNDTDEWALMEEYKFRTILKSS